MATSGTYSWTLDIAEIAEDAYERIGKELKSGYQLRTAVRSLSLILTEWANRGVNLWSIKETTQTLTADTASYTLDARYIDVLDAIIRDTNSKDFDIERISLSEYYSYSDKAVNARPSQYCIEFNATGGHTIRVYPEPDVSTYTLRMWALRYAQDVDVANRDNPEVPRKFLPALTAGLAFDLAAKNPPKYALGPQGQQIVIEGIALDVRAALKQEYDELFNRAYLEDRDRASLFLLPSVR